MKFLCDRCKTRYSIGDDRVRGKILKIRCKNCANVITVREGMTDGEPVVVAAAAASDAAAPRRNKVTTMAPPAQVATPAVVPTAPANNGSAKPPAALEEEWYVSIDGEQAGPYSLHEAQRWVGGKAANADLHCWSEGFDDWLPVDKVSHFRGLRKPAPPARSTGVSRATVQPHAQRQAEPEEEPKALFAATMATLEKGAALAAERSLALPSIKPNGTTPRATPPLGNGALAAKSNGAALPAPVRPMAVRSPTISGIHAKPEAKPIPGFDAPSEATQIEAPAFQDPEPAKPSMFAKHDAAPAPAPAPHVIESENPEDDLDIGEVSRVVKLADIARVGLAKKERTAPVRRAASMGGGVGRATSSNAAINLPGGLAMQGGMGSTGSVGAVGAMPQTGFADPAFAPDVVPELAPAAPPVQQTSRLYAVLLAVSLLLLGAVGVVVYIVTSNSDDGTTGGLAKPDDYDTTRPDDPLHHHVAVGPDTPGSAVNPFVPHPPPIHRPPPIHEGSNREGSNHDEPSPSMQLKAEEVEAEAARRSSGTTRCYMRSQKGEQAIIVGDVKRIAVTLLIDKEGSVTNVTLSEHGGDSLGVCLINQVKSWKFRENNGGTFKITMVFQGA